MNLLIFLNTFEFFPNFSPKIQDYNLRTSILHKNNAKKLSTIKKINRQNIYFFVLNEFVTFSKFIQICPESSCIFKNTFPQKQFKTTTVSCQFSQPESSGVCNIKFNFQNYLYFQNRRIFFLIYEFRKMNEFLRKKIIGYLIIY